MAELERLKQIKCFLFDMDGTINLGNTLIPGMDAFFKKLRSYGRDFYLVTNNSSKGHSHYVEKMRRMGIEVTRKNVLISSDAFVYYMQQVKPGASLYVLGTDLLKETIIKGGFKLTTLLEEKTDFVVVGFDMSLDYEKLAIACRLIDRGVPYVATHPDVRCPIEGGEFIPDCGAMIKLIETATGKKPIRAEQRHFIRTCFNRRSHAGGCGKGKHPSRYNFAARGGYSKIFLKNLPCFEQGLFLFCLILLYN